MNRGILVTAYANLKKDVTDDDVKAVYDKYYKDEINDEAENYEYKPADEKIITAAGKMYYALHYLCGVEVKFIGGRFNPDSSDAGAQDIERIKAFAADYQHTPKTAEET